MTQPKHHICFLGFQKLYNLAKSVIATLDEPDTVFHLYDCNMDTQDECVRDALEAGCTVFIAGSGNAAWFAAHYHHPLIQIRIKPIDYGLAIRKAIEAGYSKIGVLRSKFAQDYNLSAIETILDIKLTEIVYEAYSELIQAVEDSNCDAIIGAAAAVDIAKRSGKASFDVYFGTDNIREACISAARYARNVRERRENREISLAILNNSQLGVIVTDARGQITHFNRTAQTYTSVTALQARGHNIEEFFPNLSTSAFLAQNQVRADTYRLIGDTMMRCVQESVYLQNDAIAVLTTLYPEAHNRKKRSDAPKGINYHIYHWNELTANSEAMRRLIKQGKHIIRHQYPTFIMGEPGSGHEEIAYCIHGESVRAKYPCISVDLAGITGQDVRHVLIGYRTEDKSVSGLLLNANHGSIVLKNISLANPATLACIQGVLSEQQIFFPGMETAVTLDVRVFTVGSANELDNLSPDLRRQLSVQTLSMPPLRSRHEDIAKLFLKYLSKLSDEPIHFSVTTDMEKLMCEYSWPGNVLELRAVSTRYIVSRSEFESISSKQKYKLLLLAIGEKEFLEDFSRRNPVLMERPVKNSVGFKNAVTELKEWMKVSNESLADLLGISRTTLWRLLNSEERK